MIQTRGILCVNVSMSKNKRQQVVALGRLGWSLRRIEAAVHIRRETIGGYLRAAGIPVRAPGGWGRRAPAKPAIYESAPRVKRISMVCVFAFFLHSHTPPPHREQVSPRRPGQAVTAGCGSYIGIRYDPRRRLVRRARINCEYSSSSEARGHEVVLSKTSVPPSIFYWCLLVSRT